MKRKLDPFVKVQPYPGQPDKVIYYRPTYHWISGVYKITSYQSGTYSAFYLRNGDANWGWHVCKPPDLNSKGDPCWASLTAAKRACRKHWRTYEPTKYTNKRAREILAALQLKEAEWRGDL